MTTLYISNNIIITVAIHKHTDNIVFKFTKLNLKQPSSEYYETVIHKNYFTLYLAKVICLSNPNSEKILLKLKTYINMHNNTLEKISGPTPPANYRDYLKKSYKLISETKNTHIAIIKTIEELWI